MFRTVLSIKKLLKIKTTNLNPDQHSQSPDGMVKADSDYTDQVPKATGKGQKGESKSGRRLYYKTITS